LTRYYNSCSTRFQPRACEHPASEGSSMRPSRSLLGLLGAMLCIALLIGVLETRAIQAADYLLSLWWGGLSLLSLTALFDALHLRTLSSPQLQRQLPDNLPLGRWSEVVLLVQHDYPRPLRLQVIDHVPENVDFAHLPQEVLLHRGQQSTCRYRLRPLRRGRFVFPCCEITLPSPLRLWRARRCLPVPGQTRVYPDFSRLYRAQLMRVEDWIRQLGAHQPPRRGLGQDFHQLREFRDGDSLRQIDWKATARQRVPIIREYQDERDQQILFMLDCGRHPRRQDSERSHFDHVLTASLLLSYVALRQGDAVGLMSFASGHSRYLPPARGQAQIKTLLDVVYDLQGSQRPADYSSAIRTVLSRQRQPWITVARWTL
jgi:uncharacterized protein (DUF58 family)